MQTAGKSKFICNYPRRRLSKSLRRRGKDKNSFQFPSSPFLLLFSLSLSFLLNDAVIYVNDGVIYINDGVI